MSVQTVINVHKFEAGASRIIRAAKILLDDDMDARMLDTIVCAVRHYVAYTAEDTTPDADMDLWLTTTLKELFKPS